jgi:hypothetical protein
MGVTSIMKGIAMMPTLGVLLVLAVLIGFPTLATKGFLKLLEPHTKQKRKSF